MRTDSVSDAMANIKNCELVSKEKCICRPASKLLGKVLEVMKKNGYIKDFKKMDDKRDGVYMISLAHSINDCRAIKPRYKVKKDEFEKFEKRYLPSRQKGLLIISTSKGVMPHTKAREQGIGGRLIAYVY